jgi:ELWxxDGT repeat protein
MHRHGIVGIAAVVAACAGAVGQPAFVKDVNNAPDFRSSGLQWIPTLQDSGFAGGRLFFTGNDGVHGQSLWVTDGTSDGTYQVRDFPAGSPSYGSFEGLGVGNLYFFNANDGVHGNELWVSDGTESGTRLLRDFNPGINFGQPQYFAAFNGMAYFRVTAADTGNELWRSDGTPQGTTILRDIAPGADGSFGGNASRPRSLGSVLVFSAFTPAFGEELWKSDGTTAGTTLVRDIAPGNTSSAISQLVVYNGIAVFGASDGSGPYRLWRSDATSGGTFALPIPGDLDDPQRICSTAVGVFFLARTQAGARVLGYTDGTVANTRTLGPVSDCYGFGLDSMGALPTGALYPASDAAGGCELWFSNGTVAGTRRLKDIAPGVPGSYPQNYVSLPSRGLVFFIARESNAIGDELWRTDGTEEGTFAVTSLAPASPLSFYSLKPAGDVLCFAANDGVRGNELWLTDGTVKGTRFVKDIAPPREDGSSSPQGFFRVGRHAYFTAWTAATGFELWRTNGVPGATGTTMVADVYPGAGDGVPGLRDQGTAGVRGVGAIGEQLFFRGNDSATGSELWTSDGTTAGTRRVLDIITGPNSSTPGNFVGLDASLIFTATPPGSQSAPAVWRTDGTAAGTVQVTPTCTSPNCRSLPPTELVRLGNIVLFRMYDPARGTELWRTGGAADGSDTYMMELLPGAQGSTPAGFAVIGDAAVFAATTTTPGRELWITRGTPSTTSLLKDIWPGISSSLPTRFLSTGTRAYFFADAGDGEGTELWITDATTAGTRRVKNIVPGSGSPAIRTAVVSGERLYFVADDHSGIGFELWTSDGTSNGTHLVADLLPGNDDIEQASITNLAPAPDGKVVFSHTTPGHGYELWESDGTPDGTRRVSEIGPGDASSWPEQPFLFGRSVLFSAYREAEGRELWRYHVPGGACPCDWDETGGLDSRDFFAFLASFFDGAADYDGSGTTDAADFFEFLACFFNGC